MSQDAAARLMQAATTGITCAPVRDILGETDVAAAYATQDIITQDRLAKGGRLVGRKIGLTAPAVQKQLGVDQPDFGMLFADMDVMNGGTVPWNEVMQPKVEAEIAFVLGKDVTQEMASTAEVISAIDYALVSLEIVGSRIEGWNIRITDTVADNGSASHFVLGHQKRLLESVDLLNCKMSMTVNDTQVSSGLGRACLGSPINAMTWLARTLVNTGRPLKAGDIVLSGALGPMAPVAQGDAVRAEVEGFGEISVNFGTEE